MTESRKANSVRNLIFSLSAYLLNIGLSFAVRTVFIHCLAKEYLGVSGLFSNILSILSIAELGAGGAFVSLLYKPLAQNDTKRLSMVMTAYKRVYEIIAIIIVIVGLSLTPFLNYIIEETTITNIRLIYVLYIANSVASYFCVSKKSLLIADQKSYVATKYAQVAVIIQYALQMAFLLLTRNYIVYLSIQIICAVAGNVYIAYKARKLYPWLQQSSERLDKESKADIAEKIKGGFCVHFGAILANGTDSIVITKYLGLEVLGVYSNYILILDIIKKMFTLVFGSLKASACNYLLTNSVEERYSFFKRINFLFVTMVGFCTTCFIVIVNPFIRLWLDERYLLSQGIAVLAALIYSVGWYGVKIPLYITRDAFCLFTKDKYVFLFEGVSNLILSIFLVRRIGLSGVFVGTIVSSVTTWISCSYLTFHYAFKKSVWLYWRDMLSYTVAFIIVGIIAWNVCSIIEVSSLLSLILLALVCTSITGGLYVFVFRKTIEFQYFWGLLKTANYKIIRRVKSIFI